jgi:hypothetical protein
MNIGGNDTSREGERPREHKLLGERGKSGLARTLVLPRLNAGCGALNVLRLGLLLMLGFQFPGAGVFGAAQLQADLSPLGLRARNSAPIPVETRFNWDGTHLLEGRLEMEFRDGNRVLGRYRSAELALAGGEQKFRMLLPPLPLPFSDSQVEVRMRFLTAGNAVDLEPSTLFLPTAGQRSLVVAWCAPLGAEGSQQSGIERNLFVERFAPPSSERASQRLLTTSLVRMSPEDLPAQALAYTPFDVVVLSADAFKQAGERQLAALARWNKGGGSVCVSVGQGLQPQHLRFLKELSDSAPAGPKFEPGDDPNVAAARKEIAMLRSGLGRSVIVPEAMMTDLNTNAAACRDAAMFLWKMRSSQARTIAELGHWEQPTNPSTSYNSLYNRYGGRYGLPPQQSSYNEPYYGQPMSYGVQPDALGAELMTQLMPRTVRLIPFSAMVGMLALFLLMIGPVDYFLLGFLRRRRFTWVLFPATSLAFLVATVLMANHYLGLRDQRTSLTVVDLGRDGTALRWNRYELVFAARDKQALTEVKDALWAPLNVQAMPVEQPYLQVIRGRQVWVNPNNTRYMISRAGAEGESEPPLYQGTLPVRYQSSEAVRQWHPELNRTLSFEPPPVPMFPNWRAIEEAWPDMRSIRARLSEKRPFNGDVCAVSGASSITADSASTGIVPTPILEQLCRRKPQGWLSLVSQVSPTGGGNFEDIQALDLPRDAALLLVTRSGDDIVVYRRFFYGN